MDGLSDKNCLLILEMTEELLVLDRSVNEICTIVFLL